MSAIKCEHGTCGAAATHRGEWIDADGGPTCRWTLLCIECATAGAATGPGYRDLEPLRADPEASEHTSLREAYAALYRTEA